jgi:hypothetical protein
VWRNIYWIATTFASMEPARPMDRRGVDRTLSRYAD